jgi:hypothetical protein
MASRASKLLATAALAVGLSIVATAAPALAAELPNVRQPAVSTSISYSATSVSKTPNIVDYSHEIGRCSAGAPGTVCSISRTSSATNTFGVAFGLSPALVAGQLSVSYAASTSVTISCQSPPLASGRTFRAYPLGTSWGYRLTRYSHTPAGTTSTLSGPLTAFRASNGFHCAVG